MLLHPGQTAKLRFHPDAVVMGVFHHPFGHGHVFLKGMMGAIDHDGSKAAVHARLADVEIRTVIEVQHHRHIGFEQARLNELDDIMLSRILAGPGGHLKDQRGLFFGSGLHDPLDDLHVVDVKRADGVTFLIGALEHGFGSGQRHSRSPQAALSRALG